MSLDDSGFRYALKNIYYAHSADVRTVRAACAPEGGIVSGSRDNCVKVWSPEGRCYKESHLFAGATNYISSLCVLPPSEQYGTGLILAGSHDCSIYGFTSFSPTPVFRLLGHSGPVSSLSPGQFGVIVSGSWDKTARVWSGQQCNLVLQGHTQAVWTTEVFPTQNLILTGSADRTIRLWRSGVCEKIFTGHEDCVRKLAVIPDLKFLSCSNDTTVRLWSTSGECLRVFRGHSDYIYDLVLLSNGVSFATCGEDQNIKIWISGECVQTFVVAPKSLWSVACLSNGDLAVGTSDGKIYVFEKVPPDYFDKAECINESNHLSLSDSSSLNVESIVEQSVCDGETVIMYETDSPTMFVCKYFNADGVKMQKQPLDFQLISDTFFKKAQPASNKTEAVVKKADYVFDVDVENKIYKLAFNNDENPWDVANKFVAEHNLLAEHTSQVAHFIIENTAPTVSQKNEYFPATTYLVYLKINIPGLKAKLLQLSQLVPKECFVSPEEVDLLVSLVSTPNRFSTDVLAVLDKVIMWDDESIFPVLDLLRIGVTADGLLPKIDSKLFIKRLMQIFKNTNKPVNRVLISKIFCNMFSVKVPTILEPYQLQIFECIKDAVSTKDLNIQKIGSSLFLNFAIASNSGFDINVDDYCSVAVEVLNSIFDSDSVARMLIAIGTICSKNLLAKALFKSLDILNVLKKFQNYSSDSKLHKIVTLLYSFFS